MFERLIAYHILELLKKSLEEIIQRSERIRFADDFLSSNEGVILLDSICMKLSAVGESVKNLDKITKREFLSNYRDTLEKCDGSQGCYRTSLLRGGCGRNFSYL